MKKVAARILGHNKAITVGKDNRGRRPSSSKITDDDRNIVRNHINSFETVESHYYRKDSSKKHKKGQCDFCVKFENPTADKKVLLETKRGQHLQNKEAVRKQKEKDKARAANTKDLCVYVFYLQKILQ